MEDKKVTYKRFHKSFEKVFSQKPVSIIPVLPNILEASKLVRKLHPTKTDKEKPNNITN